MARQESIREALQPVQHILQASNVVLWDTESDGVGSTHDLSKTREYYLHNLMTGKSLHILRDNPNYRHDIAAQQITEFIQDVDLVVAYEPTHCDRLRLKALLGEFEFELLAKKLKFVDFKRSVIDLIVDTDQRSDLTAYVPDKKLNTVYTNLFPLEGPEPQQLLEAPANCAEVGQKCKLDVHRLCNLWLIIQTFC
jgi:hypothetical protein